MTALLTGGQLDPRTGSLVGPLAGARHTTSCCGGCSCRPPPCTWRTARRRPRSRTPEVKLALADVAAEVVVAVDSSKLGQRAPPRSGAGTRCRCWSPSSTPTTAPRSLPRALELPSIETPCARCSVPPPGARSGGAPAGAGGVGRRPTGHRPAALPAGVFDYIDGGAEDERTMAANSAAFAAVTFPAPGAARRRRGRPVDDGPGTAVCRCRWPWRRPGSPASPIPTASWRWRGRRRGPACRTRCPR